MTLKTYVGRVSVSLLRGFRRIVFCKECVCVCVGRLALIALKVAFVVVMKVGFISSCSGSVFTF